LDLLESCEFHQLDGESGHGTGSGRVTELPIPHKIREKPRQLADILTICQPFARKAIILSTSVMNPIASEGNSNSQIDLVVGQRENRSASEKPKMFQLPTKICSKGSRLKREMRKIFKRVGE
jgi:hypothetical protein